MGNPIPGFAMPDTRPGYSSQGPGDVGAMGEGINQVLMALLKRAQMDQENQELDLRRQQLQQQGQYQEGQLANESARRNADMLKWLTEQQTNASVGQGLAQLAVPEEAAIDVPALPGMVGPGFQIGRGQSLEEITQGVTPLGRGKFLGEGKDLIASREKRKEQAKTEKAQTDFVKSLPAELQGWGHALVQSKRGGLPESVLQEVGQEAFGKGLSKEAEAGIDKVLAQYAGDEATKLPRLEKLKMYQDLMRQRFELLFRPPDQGPRLRSVEPVFVKAVIGNEQRANKVDDVLSMLGYDPETGEDLAAAMPLGTARARLLNARGALGPKNIYGVRGFTKERTGTTPEQTAINDAINELRALKVFDMAGKVVPKGDARLTAFVVNTELAVPVLVNRLMMDKQFAEEQATGIRDSRSPSDYLPIASVRRQAKALGATGLGNPLTNPNAPPRP